MRKWLIGTAVLAIALSSIACGAELDEEGGSPGAMPSGQIAAGGIDNAEGEVASLDTEAQTLSIAEASGQTIEVRINEATVITIDGQPASLRDVPQDAKCQVLFDRTENMAVRIVVTTAEEEATPSPDPTIEGATPQPVVAAPSSAQDEAGEVEGTVAGVDLIAGEVTIEQRDGERLVLHLTEDTRVTVNGDGGSLSSISSGNEVRVEYIPGTHDIMLIDVQPQP